MSKATIDQIDIPASFEDPGAVSGKRVVITGASRGLGALLAHAFSRAGASVALVARTERDLKAVAALLPGPSLVLGGDVTDEDFNEAVADAAVAEWGGVDVWICNAGISPIVAGPRQTDAAVWRQVLEVNLTGAFLGARAAARVMGDGGRLILTGSVLGERPRKGLSAYSASKAGLVGLAKGLALDLAPAGITVNVVAPGWFESPLAEAWTSNPELSAAITGHTALRRWGTSDRPGRGVPVPGLRRVRVRHRDGAQRRRRLPARMTPTRRVVAITGAGGALGAALSHQFAGEPATDLVLSDVSAASLDATVAGLPATDGPVETVLADVSDVRPGRVRGRAGRRALRPPRRPDQQRRRALAERPDPQPHDRGLGARLPGQRPGGGQRHPGRGGRSCARRAADPSC